MLSFLIHYLERHILAHDKVYEHYSTPFQQKTTNPAEPMLILEAILNTHLTCNPSLEPLPKDASRKPLALKVWAKITCDAFNFHHLRITQGNSFKKMEADVLMARIICHWDWMIRGFLKDGTLTEFQDEDKKTEYLKDVLGILATSFGKVIKNAVGEVGHYSKQAVHPLPLSFVLRHF